jgi:hypothetical protein
MLLLVLLLLLLLLLLCFRCPYDTTTQTTVPHLERMLHPTLLLYQVNTSMLLLLLLPLSNRCPYDTTTQTTGATSLNECLVPPGYYVQINATNPNTGVLKKCPTNINGTGYYRSGWVSFSEAKGDDGAQACTPCGRGISSAYRDWDEIGDGAVVMAKDPLPGRVSSSSASCCE